MNYKVCKLLE